MKNWLEILLIFFVVGCGTDGAVFHVNEPVPGPAGQDGAQGEKGDKGDTGASGPQGMQGDPGIDAPVDPDPQLIEFVDISTCHQVGSTYSAKRYSTSTVRLYATVNCTGSYASMNPTSNELELLGNEGLFLVQGSGSSMLGLRFQ